MTKLSALVLVLALAMTSHGGEVRSSFETGAIALLTSEGDMTRRTGGSVNELSEYLSRLRSAGASYIASAERAPRVSGAYVVVVKPGKRSRVWVHLMGNEQDQVIVDGISSALQAVEPPTVVEGPIALSVGFRTWPKGTFPIPFVGISALYRDIGKQSEPIGTDELIKLAWPDDDG